MKIIFAMLLSMMFVMPLHAAELARNDLNSIHRVLKNTYTKTAQVGTVRVDGSTVSMDADTFVTGSYGVLDALGADPEVLVIEVRGSDVRHIVTCASGYCFDPAVDRVISESLLTQPQYNIVARGKM